MMFGTVARLYVWYREMWTGWGEPVVIILLYIGHVIDPLNMVNKKLSYRRGTAQCAMLVNSCYV